MTMGSTSSEKDITSKKLEAVATHSSNGENASQKAKPQDLEANSSSLAPVRRRWISWRPHTSKIILACSLIVIPITTFTIALLWIVFTNLLGKTDCPYPDLCPGSDLLNTTSNGVYYIDYSATRLAFLASLSSSISFSLVNILMAIYGYLIARQLLGYSENKGNERLLPSPYQTSILIRVLNAEILTLYDLITERIKDVFWRRERSGERKQKSPRILRSSILVFLLCILVSILIQAADTYLHITADSVEIIQIRTEDAPSNHLSRGLAPWCTSRPTEGTQANNNFWSCGLILDVASDGVTLANSTEIVAITSDLSNRSSILPFTDHDGIHYAVVAPANLDPSMDFKASSFGVSTQCSPIQADACDVGQQVMTEDGAAGTWSIDCTKERAGFDLEGNLTGYTFGYDYTYLDHHKYLLEGIPFHTPALRGEANNHELMASIKTEEVNDVFRNPWHWIGVPKYEDAADHYSEQYQKDPNIIRRSGMLDLVILNCNTTVYDVEYTVLGGLVTSMSKQKSNGSIAGISSMSSMATANFLMPAISKATASANFLQKSPQEFIDYWVSEMTSVLALPIATQTSPRPSELVQRRVSKLVTKMPISALWILVTANMAFAVLGLVLAILALVATSPNVHQVQARLGVAGLAAALFEKTHSERVVRSDTDLFAENVGDESGFVKKVGVRRTDTGGSAFTVSDIKV
ncbi:hypothetical protein CC78DRAFT_160888 [Lojkania enalia]|uniref:Uncharacterized protein n=1 Tax=Lojkania enalia TaxID=147567 RepID=A0A9P4KGU5_9PLEO|nr:hypothetical protein CC78DRAFT_160888 [Didymosphaeria enalia]